MLNDINDFVPHLVDEVTGEKTWYCLQPIVVKSRENSEYEVIDGQQRLTTIFLIWHYLNQDFVEKRRDKLFSLTYETRRNTQKSSWISSAVSISYFSGTIQDMMESEMNEHLGYDKYERSTEPNYRNGSKPKTVRSKYA